MKAGQKVRILRFKDSVGANIKSRVGEVGIVKEPKILDGAKMGYIVSFNDNLTTWFFPDELEAIG